MHNLSPRERGRQIDWSKTSEDYAKHRPGYPESFFERLTALGVGTPGLRVLDLGTGTGVLARQFARQGCAVTGVDIAEGQIEQAKLLSEKERLKIESLNIESPNIDFRVCSAEETNLPDNSFDLISAAQCWLYFDKQKMIPEVYRLLDTGGKLLTCHMCWLPRLDEIAKLSEELVLKHNPDWSAADFDGEIPRAPEWAEGKFELAEMFFYDEPIPFTRESWRGRFRACRGVGATLSPEQVAEFDREHATMLAEIAPESFTVLHRIDAHLFEPIH